MGTRTGPNNPNWRGGRLIASNGYVLIRVGVEHPDADIRGYAYEHKLVAQKKIGRKLRDGEQVHHKDHNKENNDPENLIVMANNAEHQVHHRKKGFNLRLPGEDNPIIHCACGCGVTFNKFDDVGRPRIFISGHNGHEESPTQDEITAFILSGVCTRKEMLIASSRSKQALAVALSRMKREGKIVSIGRGSYRLPLERGVTA